VSALLRRIAAALLAAALFLRGAGRERPAPGDEAGGEQLEREVGASRRAENAAIALMLLAALCGAAFPVLYVAWPDNQALGLSIGLALAFAAAAAVVAGKAVVPREQVAEQRAELGDPDERERAMDEVAAAGEGVTRRGALVAATGAAGLGLCAAAVTPLASFGPRVGRATRESPWASGIHLVDEHDKRLKAVDIAVGEFLTGFPEGADKEQLAAPVVIVRLLPAQFHMTPQQMAGVVDGLVAYSKICTHAACAVSMFRSPVSQPTTPSKPALVCPCHYSTFNPGQETKVEFGPAARPLPQLPLALDADGYLIAGGGYRGATGPSWWGVRQ
jgi:ubiquinol-cytochrome c reductase iron-sulfur subunit